MDVETGYWNLALAQADVDAEVEELEAIDPLTAPSEPLPDRAASLGLALRTHPRVLERKARLELAIARRGLAYNQALPQLTLSGSLAMRGWDSTQGSAWNQLTSRPAAEVRAGLTFALPLDRPAVAASLLRAQIEVEQAEAELRKSQEAVRYELESSYGQLALQRQVLSLSTQQLALAEAKLKAQTQKYQSGLSTLADVVRFQRDVDIASSALQRVVRSIRVGQARLLAAIGTLAEVRGLVAR